MLLDYIAEQWKQTSKLFQVSDLQIDLLLVFANVVAVNVCSTEQCAISVYASAGGYDRPSQNKNMCETT